MGHVYTPGLKVTEYTSIDKHRILPLKGDVMVELDQVVKPEDIVAKTELPGNVDQINLANILGCGPDDVEFYLKFDIGEKIKAGEILAQNRGLFGTGLFKTSIKMPFDGNIEMVSKVTGNVLLRAKPIPVEVSAYIEGKVSKIIPEEGVVITTNATFIQGIFGVGGERFGEIVVLDNSSQPDLTPDLVDDSHRNKILVCRRRVDATAFEKAMDIGVKAIVAGGIDDRDLKQIIGFDIGVAITGSEDISTSLVVTEGFGVIPMAQRTFDILKKYNGRSASVNGATQIRAGVIRPEIVINQPTPPKGYEEPVETKIGLNIGSMVRIIRYPYFGKLGEVSDLPPELHTLESGSKARVLKVRFDDGEEVLVPRANIETIES